MQLGVALLADFSHFVLGYGNHLSEKLELKPYRLLQIVDVQGYRVGATFNAVKNPHKCVIGFLFVAQM